MSRRTNQQENEYIDKSQAKPFTVSLANLASQHPRRSSALALSTYMPGNNAVLALNNMADPQAML